MEIERKFLVDKLLWQKEKSLNYDRIIQAYLSTDIKKSIRLRIKNDEKAIMTIKGKKQGISGEEIEFDIPIDKAKELIEKFDLPTIKKNKYTNYFNGKKWEVDEFYGDNEGLIIAEIELQSENEIFDLPPWIKDEVSYDARYFNSYLSQNPYKSWKK